MMRAAALLMSMLALPLAGARAQAASRSQEVIIDTDIGDDLDDAFALALALSSPELKIDAITVSFGDTALRARMVERLLRLSGRPDIPVAIGPATAPGTRFTQASWAAGEPAPARPFPDAVDSTLDRLRAEPAGRITLVALAPLTTVGAMIARDPVAFRRLARVVMMGGSIHRGYGVQAGTGSGAPAIEYNVARDPEALRRLLAVGVPVELMPLDATEIALRQDARARLFAAHTTLTDWLATLYPLWARANAWGPTPVLFDVVPVARLLEPGICTPVPLRLAVSAAGLTQPVEGAANASACLAVDRDRVLALLQQRLAHPG